MANVANDPKASGGHSDTPTTTAGMWKPSFPPLVLVSTGGKE